MKPCLKFWGSRENVFDMYGDYRENLWEILAVVLILSAISSVRRLSPWYVRDALNKSILYKFTATRATRCNMLHHAATRCNTPENTAARCNTLRPAATHCNTLPHTAAHFSTLQHTTTHCTALQHTAPHCVAPWVFDVQMTHHTSTLHIFTATHCNTMQHTATPVDYRLPTSTLHTITATHNNTLQHTVTQCNTV